MQACKDDEIQNNQMSVLPSLSFREKGEANANENRDDKNVFKKSYHQMTPSIIPSVSTDTLEFQNPQQNIEYQQQQQQLQQQQVEVVQLSNDEEQKNNNIQTEIAQLQGTQHTTDANLESQLEEQVDNQNLEDIMNNEDDERSQLITKSVLISWLNVYVFVGLESTRLFYHFDYKITILLLIAFDLYGFFVSFEKYTMNKKGEEDQQSFEEKQLREEFNKHLLLRVAEIFIFLLFKVLIILRFEDIHINLLIITIFLLFFVVVKIIISLKIKVKEYNPLFNEKIIWAFKIFGGIQSILIAIKVEKFVQWHWFNIFWPSFIYLIFQVVISLGFVAMLLTKCINHIGGRNKQRSNEIIGIRWLFCLQAGLTITSITYLRSFISLQQDDDQSFLASGVVVAISCFLIICIVTLIEWKGVKLFVYEMATMLDHEHEEFDDEDYDEEDEEDINQNINARQLKKKNKKKQVMKTVVPSISDKDNSVPKFLVKSYLSFSTLQGKNNHPIMINIKKKTTDIIQKIQESNPSGSMLKLKKNMNRQKSQSFMIQKGDAADHSFSMKNQVEINISTLMSDKKGESNQWKKIAIDANQKLKRLSGTSYATQSSKINTETVKKRLFMTPSQSPKIFPSHKGINFVPQNNISQDTRQQTPNVKDQTNNACFICFDNPPDSVYMPCGHGGICYDCSSHNLQTTGECFLCRLVNYILNSKEFHLFIQKPIKEILRLNLQERDKENGFRVIALTKLVDESISEKFKKENSQQEGVIKVNEEELKE